MIVGLLVWISLQIWVLGYLIAWVCARPQDRHVVHTVCLSPLITAVAATGFFYLRSVTAQQAASDTTFRSIAEQMQ